MNVADNDFSINAEEDVDIHTQMPGREALTSSAGPSSPSSSSAASFGSSPRFRKVSASILRWSRMILLPIAVVVFWLSLWNLLDKFFLWHYSFENGFVWRDLAFVLVGLGGVIAIKVFWPQKPLKNDGSSFEWPQKLIRFARFMIAMSAATLFWCGTWNFLDGIIESTLTRELVYLVLTIPLIFVLEIFCRSSSIKYMLQRETYADTSVDPLIEFEDFF